MYGNVKLVPSYLKLPFYKCGSRTHPPENVLESRLSRPLLPTVNVERAILRAAAVTLPFVMVAPTPNHRAALPVEDSEEGGVHNPNNAHELVGIAGTTGTAAIIHSDARTGGDAFGNVGIVPLRTEPAASWRNSSAVA